MLASAPRSSLVIPTSGGAKPSPIPLQVPEVSNQPSLLLIPRDEPSEAIISGLSAFQKAHKPLEMPNKPLEMPNTGR